VFRSAGKDDRFAVVGVYSGPVASEADHVRAIEVMLELATLANRADEVATLILVVDLDEGAHHPNAMWRKRFADGLLRFRRSRFALVTNSSITVGIFRIIQWLAPPNRGVARAVFESFADAVLWAEKDADCPLPFLFELYHQARQATERSSGPTPVPRPV
jgi:hypothetical protein